MKRIVVWILFGICVVGSGILGFFLFDTMSSKNNIQNEFDAYKQSAQSTQAAINTLLSQSTNKLATSVSNLAEETSKYDSAEAEVQRLARITMCLQTSFEPDYSSNSAMSSALKLYVGDTVGGNITSSTWDIIWNDSRSAIHNIIVNNPDGNIKAPYIVYFDDVSIKGVFDIGHQCWLDYQNPNH